MPSKLTKTWTMLLAMFAGALGAAEANAAQAPVSYACPANADLTVERTGRGARVTVEGRRYLLERKRSSIGDKFLSAYAALIIDGNSAVFVASDRLDLGTCEKAVPIASAR